MPEKLPVRVALIGTSQRVYNLYYPILRALSTQVELVAVWSRSAESAQKAGAAFGLPHYTDLEKLARETAAQIGIVCVSYGANGEIGLAALQAGMHVLLETPIAHQLRDADRIMQTAHERNLKIEVAEQFHRRPLEQIKLKLIASGLFGKVYSSFNDFAGHGYHGVSVMRSYLGFDAKPIRVIGSEHEYALAAHYSRLGEHYQPRNESQEHGIIEFEGGQVGIFHWTSVGYDSPLRWWRSSRFFAEKGMGITIGMGIDLDERLSLLQPGQEAPGFITLERRLDRVDGGALQAIVAHTGDPQLPIVTWENPVKAHNANPGLQWHDDEIGVAGCILSLVEAVRDDKAPTYGAYQGRLDQELITAIRQSASEGGRPIALPLDPATQYR
jgi:predicted dehydrogenase